MPWGESHEHDVAEVFGAAREHHDHRDIKARLEFVEEVTDRLLKLSEVAADSLEKAAARVIELSAEADELTRRIGLLESKLSALDQKRTADARAAFDRIAALEGGR